VQYSKREQDRFGCRKYEAMWVWEGEPASFGAVPGMGIADFNTIEGAREFLMTGFERQHDNPDIWLEMVELTRYRCRRFDVERPGS
jgi:hypothetical protein